jgi:hypothetical protein
VVALGICADEQEAAAAIGSRGPYSLRLNWSEVNPSCEPAPIPKATFRNKADVCQTFQTRDRRQCSGACSGSPGRLRILLPSTKPMLHGCQNACRGRSREAPSFRARFLANDGVVTRFPDNVFASPTAFSWQVTPMLHCTRHRRAEAFARPSHRNHHRLTKCCAA